ELVDADLGDRDDDRAGGAGDGDDVVRHGVADRLDRVHRHRLAQRLHVGGLYTDLVVWTAAYVAVDYASSILAARRDLAAALVGLGDARIHADVVLDVALDRGQRLDLLLGHVGAGTHLVGAEDVRLRRGDHLHGLEGGGGGGQVDVHGGHFAEQQVDVFLGLALEALAGHGDGVRAADAQAAGVVATVGAGGGAGGRSRGRVDDDDFGAGDRLALFGGHDATQRGGRLLRERRGGRGQDDGQCTGEARDAELFLHGHCPGWERDCGCAERENATAPMPPSRVT